MFRLKNLFCVAEGEKVTEKCFRRVLLSSICGILLCMTGLVSTTWALFSATVESQNNVIQVGTFVPSVSLIQGEIATQSGGADTYMLSQGVYQLLIVNDGTSSGYCVVTLADMYSDEKESWTTVTLDPSNVYRIPVQVLGQGAQLQVESFWGKTEVGMPEADALLSVGLDETNGDNKNMQFGSAPPESSTPVESTPPESSTPVESTPPESSTPVESTPPESSTPGESVPDGTTTEGDDLTKAE